MIIYFGVFIFFDETFNIVTTPSRDYETGEPAGPLILDTIVFHTLVCMTLFNQVNCRVITPVDNVNLAATLCNNGYFWLLFGLEAAVQQLFVHWASSTLGGSLLGMSGLTWRQQVVCWVLGVATLAVQIIAKKYVPLGPFGAIAEKIQLEEDADDNFLLRYLGVGGAALKRTKDGINEKLLAENTPYNPADSNAKFGRSYTAKTFDLK